MFLSLPLVVFGCGSVTSTASDARPDVGAPGDGRALTATWTTTAAQLATQSGAYFSFACPANGAPAPIWGTDAFTGDSAICTAAVHAGLITLTGGGVVTIEVLAGLSTYAGATSNGITSGIHGASSSTFRFPAATNWMTNASLYRGMNAARLLFICPPNGVAAVVWGTDVYTDDSSVCTAAVHAGRIAIASGGPVTIELGAAEAAYAGSMRNGVTSDAYRPGAGVRFGSFIFPP